MDAGPGVSRTFAVMAQPAARTTRRLDWVWGGGLLILGAVLPFAARPVGGGVAVIVGVTGSLTFAVAMLLFAFGRHSVVARGPLGASALVVLAVLCGFAAPMGLGVAALVVGLQPQRRPEASLRVFPTA